MMPMLPVVRVKSIEQGIEFARKSEHGYKHSAIIHSLNVDHMTMMARALGLAERGLFTAALMAGATERQAMADLYRRGGFGYGEVKKALVEAAAAYFAAARARRTLSQRRPGAGTAAGAKAEQSIDYYLKLAEKPSYGPRADKIQQAA